MVGTPINGRALPGETRDDYRVRGETVLAPPVCCPWRNRASGIPPIYLLGPIKAEVHVLVSLQLIETPPF